MRPSTAGRGRSSPPEARDRRSRRWPTTGHPTPAGAPSARPRVGVRLRVQEHFDVLMLKQAFAMLAMNHRRSAGIPPSSTTWLRARDEEARRRSHRHNKGAGDAERRRAPARQIFVAFSQPAEEHQPKRRSALPSGTSHRRLVKLPQHWSPAVNRLYINKVLV